MTEARIIPIGNSYIPIRDVELFDEKQNIWRGKIVDHPDNKISSEFVYFWRFYSPEKNELDLMWPEFSFDERINGHPFLLVPKEKVLFGYFPPSTIHLPSPETLRTMRHRPGMP